MTEVKCPKCGSLEVGVENYLGVDCILCKDCGYDECKELEVYPEEKTHTDRPVYRTGGPKGKR